MNEKLNDNQRYASQMKQCVGPAKLNEDKSLAVNDNLQEIFAFDGGGWWTCTILYKQYCSCSFSTQNTSKLLVSVYGFCVCAEFTLYYTIHIDHNERF